MTITLSTLPQATAQEVFDQVATHLLKQNKQSVYLRGDSSICGYRGTGNTKCAAGCLISDAEYSVKFEGVNWPRLIQKGFAPKEHSSLIHALQNVHDASPVEDWEEMLQDVAKTHNLIFKEPT